MARVTEEGSAVIPMKRFKGKDIDDVCDKVARYFMHFLEEFKRTARGDAIYSGKEVGFGAIFQKYPEND